MRHWCLYHLERSRRRSPERGVDMSSCGPPNRDIRHGAVVVKSAATARECVSGGEGVGPSRDDVPTPPRRLTSTPSGNEVRSAPAGSRDHSERTFIALAGVTKLVATVAMVLLLVACSGESDPVLARARNSSDCQELVKFMADHVNTGEPDHTLSRREQRIYDAAKARFMVLKCYYR